MYSKSIIYNTDKEIDKSEKSRNVWHELISRCEPSSTA